MAKIRAQARRVGIFGASGSGKTTKALEIIKNIDRLIVFDPLDEFGYKFVKFTDVNYLKSAITKNYARGFKVRFVPELSKAKEQLSQICIFLRELQAGYKFSKFNSMVTLFVDELDVGFPLNESKINGANGFYYLCCRGRHYGINIVGVSQRMSLVDLPFRANLSDLYLFRLADFNDIKNACAMIGSNYKSRLQALSNFQYLYKKPSGEILIKT